MNKNETLITPVVHQSPTVECNEVVSNSIAYDNKNANSQRCNLFITAVVL